VSFGAELESAGPVELESAASAELESAGVGPARPGLAADPDEDRFALV